MLEPFHEALTRARRENTTSRTRELGSTATLQLANFRPRNHALEVGAPHHTEDRYHNGNASTHAAPTRHNTGATVTVETDKLAVTTEEAAYYDRLHDPKHNRTTRWVDAKVREYDAELATIASKPLGASKRQAKEDFALRRFVNHFTKKYELPDGEKGHILFDADGLAISLEYLETTKHGNDLRDAILGSIETFMSGRTHGQSNAISVTNNPSELAKIISHSVRGDIIGDAFDKILKWSLAEAGSRGYAASSAYVDLAGAALELIHNQAAIHKILDTLDSSNSVLADPASLHRGWLLDGSMQLSRTNTNYQHVAEIVQADRTFRQLRIIHRRDHPSYADLTRGTLPAGIAQVAKLQRRQPEEVQAGYQMLMAAITNAGSYEDMHIEHLGTGNMQNPDFATTRNGRLDPGLEEALTNCPLFRKRITRLGPAALTWLTALDLLIKSNEGGLASEHSEGQTSFNAKLISPQHLILTASLLRPGETDQLGDVGRAHAVFLGRSILARKPEPEHGVQIRWQEFTLPGYDRPNVIAVERLASESDIKAAPTWDIATEALYRLHGDRVFTKPAPEFAQDLEQRRQHIKTNTYNYLGQRELEFKLPAHWQDAGFGSNVRIRRHQDRRRVLAQLSVNGSPLALQLNERLELLGKEENPDIPDNVAQEIELLVLKLVEEWCCRPNIETSEGTINQNEGKSSIRGGSGGRLVRLGVDPRSGNQRRPSLDQEAYFQDEQPDSPYASLLEAAERLWSEKPDWLESGRFVTYVKEKHNPDDPPLTVRHKAEL